MPDQTHAYSLLVKPNSDICSLNCSYCFYKGSRWHTPQPMTIAEVQAMTQGYRRSSAVEVYVWQGGEPCDLGAEFFSAAVAAQGEHAMNSIQTNGLAFAGKIGGAWKLLLTGKGNWVVGLSHDGPTNRSKCVKTSVLDLAAANLAEIGVPFCILCVVSEENVDNAAAVVRHFYQDEFGDAPIQFLHARGSIVTGLQFGHFLGQALHATPDKGKRLRNFNAFDMAWQDRPVTCENLEECGTYLMVDSGYVYPCDHFGTEEWVLATMLAEHRISVTLWEDAFYYAFTSDRMKEFRKLKTTRHTKCEPCSVRKACARGCPADRVGGGLSEMCGANAMVAHITHPGRDSSPGAKTKE